MTATIPQHIAPTQTYHVATSFKPEVIMSRPDTLARLVETYFQLRTAPPPATDQEGQSPQPDPPKPVTPASLALFLGFSSVPQMLSAVEDQKYMHESRHALMSALTHVEALLSEDAMTERLNVSFTKFMLSARLGVIEKKEEIKTDNTLNINILGVSDSNQNVQVNVTHDANVTTGTGATDTGTNVTTSTGTPDTDTLQDLL